MISYHPGSLSAPVGTTYTSGFKVVDTDDVHRIAKGISRFAWSPCVWKDGYRAKKNFLQADWFALDFDTNELSLAQAVKSFSDMIHVIGTTRNHQKIKDGVTCDRFRVLIKASRRIDSRQEFEANMRRLSKVWPIDAACCDAARHFFKCVDIVSVVDEGYTEDVALADEKEELTGDAYAKELERLRIHHTILGKLPPWVTDFLEQGAADRRHFRAFGAAIEMLERGISLGAVIARIKAAPITRQWRQGEIEDIVFHAQQRIHRRLHDSQEQGG